VSESAASAKRVWFMFGAKPAQSETPVRARGQAGVHPEEGAVERKTRSYLGISWVCAWHVREFASLCRGLVMDSPHGPSIGHFFDNGYRLPEMSILGKPP
jgi:hypothetical protein